jgi:hypothetical protein
MTKREAFVSVMQMLSETFNRPLSPGMLDGYWMALEDLETPILAAAAKRAIVESKFMPAPSEMLALAGRAPESPDLAAMRCWDVVRKAIDKHDYLVRSIDFGARVNAVISNLGGWDVLCRAKLTELDNPGWLRKRFCEAYEAFANTPVYRLRGDALAGALPPKWNDPRDILVPIEGEPHPLALPAVNPEVRKHVEALAEELSTEAS